MTTIQTTISPDATLDEAFTALSHERRRAVFRCLQSADGPVGVADLARDVVARERDADGRAIPDEAVERCYVRLHHVHLPKLTDAGFLHYDQDQTTVALADDIGSVGPLLDWATEQAN
ncbi:hypothetical protein SAMN05216559_2409 [Halomicrobium zhouii]|uniref:DUF7344 domain-containing protein n=1 Tax=Halomicrobium zhouii TaxID=767519 RepID=A0A1I6LBH1_9EURY|nr:hypothetical protein [Halomicrobium zhouii]SFS00813.1 hypothetical protein SAMN05216559_2409 [Halomicrobium zhouii]